MFGKTILCVIFMALVVGCAYFVQCAITSVGISQILDIVNAILCLLGAEVIAIRQNLPK